MLNIWAQVRFITLLKAGRYSGYFFDKNLLRYIEALRMMGMVIMRPIALDVVFAFIGDDNGIAGQQVFPILFRKDLGFFFQYCGLLFS